MAVQLPPCPASLRSVQHYLKTASDYDQRDVVISYWCRLYGLQTALKIDRSSDGAKVLLMALMDWLEKQKRDLADNESVTNEVAAQAYLENAALKLFYFADGQDRAANFGKDVVKAFYTAGMLFDVLTTFGELSEEIQHNRKYAKWKAAYIHKCLKAGERPQPGPMKDELEDGEDGEEEGAVGGFVQPPPPTGFSTSPSNASFPSPPSNFPAPGNYEPPPSNYQPPPSNYQPPPSNYQPPPSNYQPPPSNYQPPPSNYQPPPAIYQSPVLPERPATGNGEGGSNVQLTAEQLTKAQKYCKWAGSSLSYDDVNTAILNLKKALKLLETGVDS